MQAYNLAFLPPPGERAEKGCLGILSALDYGERDRGRDQKEGGFPWSAPLQLKMLRPWRRRHFIELIGWKDAFWVASGVPALVLFSIGGIAATVGTPSVLVWTLSVLFGFIQAFTYAEIAGLFPNKSGGASVYGAAAWVRYSKFIAPLSVWCNWLAWTPVLAIGCGIAAGYILNALFPPDAAIRTWEIQLLDLGFLKENLKLRLNSTFFIGAILIAISFAIQHRGILSTAKVQTIVGVAVLLPLLIIGIVPLITGDVAMSAFQPFAPGTDPADRRVEQGWLGVVLRRSVHRRLVGLRFRNGHLLHQRVPATRRPIPTRPSSIPACSASPSTSSCRSPSRALSALPASWRPASSTDRGWRKPWPRWLGEGWSSPICWW